MNRSKLKIKKYKFKATLWKYKGASSWYFLTLPQPLSETIRQKHGYSEEGWGRLKTQATIHKTEWNTAIWFDTKFEAYLLPVKADIRKKEGLREGDAMNTQLTFIENTHSFARSIAIKG